MTGVSATNTRITLRLPDDFHTHLRDGSQTAAVLALTRQRFGRILVMPNLVPPVVNTEQALKYKQHVLESLHLPPEQQASSARDSSNGSCRRDTGSVEPLMTLYLTDRTTAEEIAKAAEAGVVGCKYYPAGATTNSDFGVTDIRNCYSALEEMARRQMMLCIHSEVTDADIFEREPVFIERVMVPLVRDFPTLKITMEHISTREAVEYVKSAPSNVKASITCHHLLFNRNRK